MRFADRTDAGRQLGRLLRDRLAAAPGAETVVVGLPRGGVPVAAEVATALGAPLDVLLVHKIGVPFQPEYAMGAVGDGGYRVLDEQTVRWSGVTPDQLEDLTRREVDALRAKSARLRRGREPLPLAGRTVVVVDDGAATGLTARAACHLARAAGAARVVVGLPVASSDAVRALRAAADDLIVVEVPGTFWAVGEWYDDFRQTSDGEVVACLDAAWAAREAASGPGHNGAAATSGEDPPGCEVDVVVPADGVTLPGTLVRPAPGHGVVVFAHGSGSSRTSPRNRYVAQVLQGAGLGTLLLDLLTAPEETDRSLVFDVALLARRLLAATAWLRTERSGVDPAAPVGLFGASTGAAAALVAAALPASRSGVEVRAVVSRGGRPDLADGYLREVRAPTLLIVGSRDERVLDLNRQAQAQLRCRSRLEVVPGATHLFEEPGTLAAAAGLARDWFADHLGAGAGGVGAS